MCAKQCARVLYIWLLYGHYMACVILVCVHPSQIGNPHSGYINQYESLLMSWWSSPQIWRYNPTFDNGTSVICFSNSQVWGVETWKLSWKCPMDLSGSPMSLQHMLQGHVIYAASGMQTAMNWGYCRVLLCIATGALSQGHGKFCILQPAHQRKMLWNIP
jgi:hypothetical protein